MSSLTQVERGGSNLFIASAGIGLQDRFSSPHKILDQDTECVITLAKLNRPRFRDNPALFESMTNIAKAWQVMAGYSGHLAGLLEFGTEDNIVIIGSCGITFADSRLIDLEGQVDFKTLVEEVDPKRKTILVSSRVVRNREVIADTSARLVFKPAVMTEEERERVAKLSKRAQALSHEMVVQTESSLLIGEIASGLRLPPLYFDIQESARQEVAKVSGDKQDIHNPGCYVWVNSSGEPKRDDTGRIMRFYGEKNGSQYRQFGRITMFGKPIAYGVWIMLPVMAGVVELSDKAGPAMVIGIKSVSANFIQAVGYGSRLQIEEKVIDIVGTEWVGGDRLTEGKVRLAVACSAEDGAVLRNAQILAEINPLI